MRVLVTGATGFTGPAVVSALRGHGHDVRVLTRRAIDMPGTEAVLGDILDPAAVTRAVHGVDAVCHLAAATRVRDSAAEPVKYWQTNTVGTLNVLAALAALDTPKRIVLASTAAVYGTPERQPISEDAQPAPTSPYGRSKLAADQAAADLATTGSIGAVSLRAFNVCGAASGIPDHDRTRLIPKVLAVQAGLEPELTVNGDGSAVRDFVHVVDMAEAFALAVDACEPGEWRPYNVGSGERSTVADVIRAAEQVTGSPVPARHRPAANEPPVLLADSTRIRSDLGWQPKNSALTQILADGWNAVTSGYAADE